MLIKVLSMQVVSPTTEAAHRNIIIISSSSSSSKKAQKLARHLDN